MNTEDLQRLNSAVGFLVAEGTFQRTVKQLDEEIGHASQAFVWTVIDLDSITVSLPEEIRSCWVFVLKKNVPSGCHYHPNSVQHMVMIRGRGESFVGGISRKMREFGDIDFSLTDLWYVIDKNVQHEFLPLDENMVVVSFHTCVASDLIEVDCRTGERRVYEE